MAAKEVSIIKQKAKLIGHNLRIQTPNTFTRIRWKKMKNKLKGLHIQGSWCGTQSE